MRTIASVALLIAAAGLVRAADNNNPQSPLEAKVRHELNMLPWVTVFDDLSYRVDDSTVTLFGDVTRPIVKSDAENAVKRIEGVTRVIDNINVLPLSSMDDRIRMAEFRAIYSYPALQHYGVGALKSIRIIVNNGHVTLKGIVDSQADSQLAYMRANGVPYVFSVTNELQVVQ